MTAKLVFGNIIGIPSDAIITLANPNGIWRGQLDRSIERAAADLYVAQLNMAKQRLKKLQNGAVIPASGDGVEHGGAFRDVLYVIDDDTSPLRTLVFSGLSAARLYGLEWVTLPLMRSGHTFKVVEQSLSQIAEEMVEGIREFERTFPDSTLQITIVIRNPRKYAVVAPLMESMLTSQPTEV